MSHGLVFLIAAAAFAAGIFVGVLVTRWAFMRVMARAAQDRHLALSDAESVLAGLKDNNLISTRDAVELELNEMLADLLDVALTEERLAELEAKYSAFVAEAKATIPSTRRKVILRGETAVRDRFFQARAAMHWAQAPTPRKELET